MRPLALSERGLAAPTVSLAEPLKGSGHHWLADRIGDELLDAVILTTGPEAYRRPDGIGVVPAALLGP